MGPLSIISRRDSHFALYFKTFQVTIDGGDSQPAAALRERNGAFLRFQTVIDFHGRPLLCVARVVDFHACAV
jgi:hypothetical protein